MNSICSITVTYNPDKRLLNQIKILKKCIKKILIFDNGSFDLKLLKLLQKKYKINIIYNKYNIGLASGLNIGIKFALENKFKWILTLDQDSIPDKNMINNMLKIYFSLSSSEKNNIAGLFPMHIEKIKNKINSGIKYIDIGITSGSLFKTEIFNQIGFFEEKLFIDYIDYEFCLRAKSYGYKFLQVKNSILFHKIGNTNEIYFLGKNRSVLNHSPIRRYYMTRNRFYTYKKFYKLFPNYVKHDFKCFLKEIIKILLFEDQKIQKILMIFLGIFHFIINRYKSLK